MLAPIALIVAKRTPAIKPFGDGFFRAVEFGCVTIDRPIQIVLAGNPFREIVTVKILLAMARIAPGGTVGIAQVERHALERFFANFAFGASECFRG